VIGVVDACFIIDWCRYRRRELLERLFSVLFIHEETLGQLRSEKTITYVSDLLAKGKLRLYPWSHSEEDEYLRLRSEIVVDPRIPSLERPDMLCLIMAKRLNAILLSENIGIHRVIEFHSKYSNVVVWTALETLENIVYKGFLNVHSAEDFLRYVREYEHDTSHIFKSNRLKQSLRRIGLWLRR